MTTKHYRPVEKIKKEVKETGGDRRRGVKTTQINEIKFGRSAAWRGGRKGNEERTSTNRHP
jgi:hypothetical protein